MPRLIVLLLFSLSGFQFLSAQKGDVLLAFAADPGAGFNYPYFVFIPATCLRSEKVYLLVEPNNLDVANDSFRVLTNSARAQALLGPLGNQLARELNIPLLVPVFPKTEKDGRRYAHMLDADVMKRKRGPTRRLDLQLMAMIESGKSELKKLGYVLQDQILMTGYAASGVFANRFACLHPALIRAYAAGGTNGLLMMPFAQWNGVPLNYPLGTSDYQTYTGEPFDFDAFQQMYQFLFMGEKDTYDEVLMNEAYAKSDRKIIFSSFGQQMQPDRWFACQLQYKIATHRAQFRTYSEAGHALNRDIFRDLVRFFSSVSGGEVD